jgi:hypothetical protein
MRARGGMLSGLVDLRCLSKADIRDTLSDITENAALLGVGNRPEVVAAIAQFNAKWAPVATELAGKEV